jgi:hypothetical protein
MDPLRGALLVGAAIIAGVQLDADDSSSDSVLASGRPPVVMVVSDEFPRFPAARPRVHDAGHYPNSATFVRQATWFHTLRMPGSAGEKVQIQPGHPRRASRGGRI